MNDLAQDRMTKPKSDDMSMDEILASIRKIISSTDDTVRNKDYDDSTVRYAQTKDMTDADKKMAQSLSAREQLLSLTKPDLYDSDFGSVKKRPQTDFKKPAEAQRPQQEVKQKSVYQKLNQETDIQTNYTKENLDKTDHDEEILRALNEIRDTLSSSSVHTTVQNALERDIFDKHKASYNASQETTHNHAGDLPTKSAGKIIDASIAKHKDNFLDGIDLKPAQFSGDAVPEFLKKFKRQQEVEREKGHTSSNNPNYSFSKLPTFDDTDDVVNLTENVMPMSQDALKQQQEKAPKTNFSKLRQDTQEIMRRATEHNFGDDAENDLSEEDSPMANLIMRTLKPMLQEWIHENMHIIAEQVLRQEFRRGLK